jgi:arylsulfatase A-like enzyme
MQLRTTHPCPAQAAIFPGEFFGAALFLFPMKSFLSLTLALASLFCLTPLAGGAPAPQPNIVFFLVDDLGRADVGFMGGKDIRTPNIDKLAREGAVLDSYYVQPVCSPTRAALLTGRYATHTGVYTVVRPRAPWGLPLAERLLPQALRDAGYQTAICGKWHLGEFQPEYMPTKRGFDRQYGHMFGALDYFTHIRDGKSDWYRDDKPVKEEGYSTHLIAKEACRIIAEKPKDRPLFLYVPFNGIHAPHQVPEKYTEPYADLKGVRRTIAGMLSAVDEAIGQITDALTKNGLRDNTLILFSSDNGGPNPNRATMNTPLRAGKGTLYEGGIRVCAFATWPGKIPAGVTIRQPLHAVDWYPTLLKLACPPSEQQFPIDGLDIWPVLTQNAPSPHKAILIPGPSPAKAALRMGEWKLLLNASEKDAEDETDSDSASSSTPATGDTTSPAARKLELYNLEKDIGETKNLAESNPDKVKEMRTVLDAMLANAVAPGGKPAAPQNAPARPGAKKARKKAAGPQP